MKKNKKIGRAVCAANLGSGEQQAERMAGRATRMVCPEKSPQCARRRSPFFPMGNDAPTTAREQGLQPYGAFTLFFRWPEGVQGASGKPPACIGMCQPCRKKFPAKGLDAPTTARVMGLPPRRGIVLSFGAKESTKESMRHGDSRGGPPRFASRASACGSPFGAVLGLGSLRSPAGKRLLLPILPAGLVMSRAA